MFFSRPRPTLRNRKSRSNNSSSLTKKHKFFSNERSLNSIQIRDNSIVRCNRNNRSDLRARFRHGNSFLFLFSFFFFLSLIAISFKGNRSCGREREQNHLVTSLFAKRKQGRGDFTCDQVQKRSVRSVPLRNSIAMGVDKSRTNENLVV